MQISEMLKELGVSEALLENGDLSVYSPIDGNALVAIRRHSQTDVGGAITRATEAFHRWKAVPPPKRGELVRLFADELRRNKCRLARLVSMENGKILSEAEGEVQEMIDICDFAVGLSRQLHGLTIASERAMHRMMETWHPLGVVGVITAFNFPVAVWAWNAALALVCGNAVLWKPSEKTPLSALAAVALFDKALDRFGEAPRAICQVLIGDRRVGEQLADDDRIALLSATGSTRMGKAIAPRVAQRLGRYLLELGGNNAIVVAPSADLDLAVRAIAFSAVGTAGQRCTSARRLIVHTRVADELCQRLKRAYASVKIGSPLDAETLVGPLIDQQAYLAMQDALGRARDEGGLVYGGQRVLEAAFPRAWYVAPAIVEMPRQSSLMLSETFAPILYVLRYDEFSEAICLHNAVPQGLSSAIFTHDLREAEQFLSVSGSDCGIANVNIGTSGAEIGGAFGGEKETGGGRESGSDAWKAYMRRATNTINYSDQLPLAQGVRFDLDR